MDLERGCYMFSIKGQLLFHLPKSPNLLRTCAIGRMSVDIFEDEISLFSSKYLRVWKGV